MNVKIRKAVDKDIDAIVKLNTLLADYHRQIDAYYKEGKDTADGFKRYLRKIMDSENHLILVAVDRDIIAGYFLGEISDAKAFLSPAITGRISDAFITKAYRRHGIGKMFFDEMIQWFKQHTITHVELSVDVRNTIGVKAWQKYGFQAFMLKMKREI